jgi:hypothetical protein
MPQTSSRNGILVVNFQGFILREHLGSPPDFGVVRVAHLFCFQSCVSSYCVTNTTSVSGLSILDCPFDFL